MKPTTTLAFTGDIGFDHYMQNKWEDENLIDPALLDVLTSSNHVIANVEGPLAGEDAVRVKAAEMRLMHTIDPKAVVVLKKIHADIWNLANNHIMDVGPDGLSMTLEEAARAGALTIGAVLLIMRNDSANYGLLMRKAQAALEVGQSDLALQCLMEAEAVMPEKSLELPLMKSEIMRDTGRYEDAEAILYELLTRSSSRTIYDRLICCLEEDEAYEEIASLLQRSRDPSLLEDYGAYVAEAPEMSLMNGDTYAFGTLLTLTCSGKGSIYYTVDWSEPDETSLLYEDSIPLQVGTNRIKAVFINEKGIKSPVSAAIFNVRRAPRTAA